MRPFGRGILSRGKPIYAPGWDTAFTAAPTYSGSGSITATSSASTAAVIARSVARGGYKIYLEILHVLSAGLSPDVGLVDDSLGPTSLNLGDTVHSIGWSSGGAVRVNGSTVGTATGFSGAGTKTLRMAFDLASRRFWAKVDSGNWNASGTADPATGVGGFDISAFTGPELRAAYQFNAADPGTSGTLRATLASLGASPPTGFNSLAGN